MRRYPAIAVLFLLTLISGITAAAQSNTATTTTTTVTSEYGTLLKLQLKASKLRAVTLSHPPAFDATGTGQCPGIGLAQFTYNTEIKEDPGNDTTQYFDGVHNTPVLEIAHVRVTTTVTANGNTVTQRQDWTRIKENDNGIDNTTGVRHYIGNFAEETQTPANGPPVITAESQGVMTLLEPLFFSTGPLVGVANRVNVVQYIGSQPAWLEPFAVSDARQCRFLETGVPQPVDPKYNDKCVADSGTTYTYNGVTYTGNIVGCAQTTWP